MRQNIKGMARELRQKYGFDSPKVTTAMRQVPRHHFVPKQFKGIAYEDAPISIGFGQTMSQPFTVAFMTNLLNLTKTARVLEVGTGSGYQAAVLAKLAREVYTLEIVPQLAESARKVLKKLGYTTVFIKTGSGEWGWEEHAPFDAIIVTAAVEEGIPRVLFDQLKNGGVLVAPIGPRGFQIMTRFTKKLDDSLTKEEFGRFVFVPFVEKRN